LGLFPQGELGRRKISGRNRKKAKMRIKLWGKKGGWSADKIKGVQLNLLGKGGPSKKTASRQGQRREMKPSKKFPKKSLRLFSKGQNELMNGRIATIAVGAENL